MFQALPWHRLMRGRSLEGHTYNLHRTHKHTKGCVWDLYLEWKPYVLPTQQSEKGLTRGDRVLLSLTQQSVSTQLLCVKATTVAAGGSLNLLWAEESGFVTGYLWEKPIAINMSGENKQKIRDARSPNHQISNLKWRGNKTLITDPIHRFIPSTFTPPTLMK